jgi:hypothetical protein
MQLVPPGKTIARAKAVQGIVEKFRASSVRAHFRGKKLQEP